MEFIGDSTRSGPGEMMLSIMKHPVGANQTSYSKCVVKPSSPEIYSFFLKHSFVTFFCY